MRRNNLKIPTFFELYFQEGFEDEIFTWKHDVMLRKLAIQHFVFSASDSNVYLLKHIFLMLKDFHVKINIHNEFPQKQLVKAFRPYVYIYLLIEYGHLHNALALYYDNLLYDKFEEFEELYPRFGRIYIQLKKPPIFHTEYLVFHSFHL